MKPKPRLCIGLALFNIVIAALCAWRFVEADSQPWRIFFACMSLANLGIAGMNLVFAVRAGRLRPGGPA